MVENKSATFASYTALFLLALTLAGLIWSRAVLSIVHIFWLVAASIFFAKQRHLFKKSRLLIWSITPLFLFLPGLYQQPFAKGNAAYIITLCIYPITALAVTFLLKNISEKKFLAIWMIFAVASLALPFYNYLQNFSGAYLMYARAKTLKVWMDADHVRYGLFLCSALLFLLFFNVSKLWLRYTVFTFIFLMIVLLASRTAWVGAALIILIYAWQKIRLTKYEKLRWLIPVALVAGGAASYQFVDTVRGKIDYMVYDWQLFEAKKYNADFSDGTRRNINYTAWKVVTTEGKSNAGWAGISPTLKNSFKNYFPAQQTEYGWPFNQWLYWWIGAGWWTAILFTGWLFYPLVYGLKKRNYPLVTWTLIIAASCMVEATLSLQYGVFLHAWVIAILWSTSEYDNL